MKIKHLKHKLVLLVMLCWLGPLLAIAISMGWYMTTQVNGKMTEMLKSNLEHSSSISAMRIDEAIKDSQAASYDGVLEKIYLEYLTSEKGERSDRYFYKQVQFYLQQKYKEDSKFSLTVFTLLEETEKTYMLEDRLKNGDPQAYNIVVHQKALEISKTLGTATGFLVAEGKLYMVRNMVDRYYNPYAMLVMELSTWSIFDGFMENEWCSKVAVTVNSTEFRLFDNNEDSDKYVMHGEEKNTNCKFAYAATINDDYFGDTLTTLWINIVLICSLALPMIAVVLWFFRRNINCPLDAFASGYSKIEDGQLGIHIEENLHSVEFNYCKTAFNHMSDELNSQIKRLYAEEVALRDARIMALQSQINPHFLNNTLEIINWEARMAGDEKVSHMIEALSVMLDAALDRKAKHKIAVSEELTYVDAYLYIISERLGKRMKVEKLLDESLFECLIPRLTLQPIIENAIEHGVETVKNGVLTLKLHKSRDGGYLLFDIESNSPMSDEDRKNVRELLGASNVATGDGILETIPRESSIHLGIKNINQRLQILYGENAGLTIEPIEKEDGTKITRSRVKIPIDKTIQ